MLYQCSTNTTIECTLSTANSPVPVALGGRGGGGGGGASVLLLLPAEGGLLGGRGRRHRLRGTLPRGVVLVLVLVLALVLGVRPGRPAAAAVVGGLGWLGGPGNGVFKGG